MTLGRGIGLEIRDASGTWHPIRPPGMLPMMPRQSYSPPLAAAPLAAAPLAAAPLGSPGRSPLAAATGSRSPSRSPGSPQRSPLRVVSSPRRSSSAISSCTPHGQVAVVSPETPTPPPPTPPIVSPTSAATSASASPFCLTPTSPAIEVDQEPPDFVCPHCNGVRSGTLILLPRGINHCMFVSGNL